MSSSVGRNSLIMASGTAASRVTGQIRTILLAWALGTSTALKIPPETKV